MTMTRQAAPPRHAQSLAVAGPADTPPARRRRLPIRRTIGVLTNVMTLVGLLGFLALGVGPHTGAYRTITMLSGSMQPSYPVGAVLIITPQPIAELLPGQVVTFHAPIGGQPVVTHRVVSVDRSGNQPVIVTKGDANPGEDAWRVTMTGATYWQVRGAVPLLGTALRAARDPAVSAVLTKALPVLLLLGVLTAVWRPKRRTG